MYIHFTWLTLHGSLYLMIPICAQSSYFPMFIKNSILARVLPTHGLRTKPRYVFHSFCERPPCEQSPGPSNSPSMTMGLALQFISDLGGGGLKGQEAQTRSHQSPERPVGRRWAEGPSRCPSLEGRLDLPGVQGLRRPPVVHHEFLDLALRIEVKFAELQHLKDKRLKNTK